MCKKIINASIAFLIILSSLVYVSAADGYPTITRDFNQSYDGFDVEFWRQSQVGEGSMTLTGGGTFACHWKGVDNMLLRIGKKLGSKQTYHEYGDIIIDYAADYKILSGSVSYLTVYGWTQEPLIEYYIVEDRGSYKPAGGKGSIGMYDVGGEMYELITDTRVEMPSIEGTKTFGQYYAVNVYGRTEGVIDVGEHFRIWEEEFGLDMSGNLYEVSMCVEGYQNSGYADIYKHVLTIGDEVMGEHATREPLPRDDEPEPQPDPQPRTEPNEPETPLETVAATLNIVDIDEPTVFFTLVNTILIASGVLLLILIIVLIIKRKK